MNKTDIEISHRNIIGGSIHLGFANFRFWNNVYRFDEIKYSGNMTVIIRHNIMDLVRKIARMMNIRRIKERIESNDKRRRILHKNS